MKQAQYYDNFPCKESFYIKYVEHPAVASYGNRPWKHNNMFSWIDNILKQNDQEIDWYEKPF